MNEQEARERIRQMISFVQEEAKEKAREIESKTEHDYNLAKAKFLHEARQKLTTDYEKKWKELEIQKKIDKSAAINSSRMEIMQSRSECMESLIEETRFAIDEKVQNDQGLYRDILKKLIVEGLIKLLDPEVEVLCRECDVSLVDGVLRDAKSEYEEVIQRETGKEYSVNLSTHRAEFLPARPERGSNTPGCIGGVVLMSQKGKIRCINTLDERLKLTYAASVPLLRKVVFNEGEMESSMYPRNSIEALEENNRRMKNAYANRMERTYAILHAYNPELADEVFSEPVIQERDSSNESAIFIEKHYRGHLARKLYKDLLYDLYTEEMDKEREEEMRKMEEGMMMLENLKLEEQIKEKEFLAKETVIEKNCAATLVERAFRKHLSLKMNKKEES